MARCQSQTKITIFESLYRLAFVAQPSDVSRHVGQDVCLNMLSLFIMKKITTPPQLYVKILTLIVLLMPAVVVKAQMPRWVEAMEYNCNFMPSQIDFAEGYFYLAIDEQVNIPLQEVYYHTAVKVAEETGLSAASQINTVFNSAYQTIRFTHITIIRQNESIDILKNQKPEIIRRESNLEQDVVNGEETAFLKIAGVKVGDIIDYGVVMKGFNPAKKDFFYNKYYLGYSSCVGKINIRILTDEPQLYHYQLCNVDLEPSISKNGNYTVFGWSTVNPIITSVESDAPSWYDPYPSVDFFKKKTWNEVSAYSQTLFNLKEPLSPELLAWIRTVRQLSVNEDDAASALIRDVQNQIRYLGLETGVNGLKPRHPNVIFNNKAGDCKEKSWLLSVALQRIGYKAFPVLVNTDQGHTLPQMPASVELFNHCVVCIIEPTDTIWIDPTISNQGGDLKSTWFPNYEYGLIVDGKSKSLCAIKPRGEMETEVFEKFVVNSFSEPILFEVKTIYQGGEADNQRGVIKSQSLRQMQQQYLKFYAEMYPHIDTLSTMQVSDDLKLNQLTVTEDYQVSNLWYAPDSLKATSLRADFFPLSLKYYLNHETHVNRKSPLFQRFPLVYNHHIQVVLPEQWNLNNEQKNITGKGFDYSRTVSYQDNKLDLSYRYITKASVIPVADYAKYIEQHDKIINDLSYSLTYGDVSLHPEKKGINIPFIAIAILTLIIAIYSAYKLYYYDPEVIYCYQNDNRELRGWTLFAAIIVFFQPLVGLVQLSVSNLWDASLMSRIFNPASPQYSEFLGWLLIVKFVLMLILFVFSVILAVLMYNRRSSVPQLVIFYFVGKVLLASAFYLIAGFSQESTRTLLEPYSNGNIVVSICLTGVFVGFFASSESVKETFTQRLKPKEISPGNVR